MPETDIPDTAIDALWRAFATVTPVACVQRVLATDFGRLLATILR
jgi:hypothetical protein